MTDDLGQILTDLGRAVQFPATPDLAGRVSEQLRQTPRRTRWFPGLPLGALGRPVAAVLLAAAVIVGGLFAVSPAARAAVGGWLGIPGIRITVGGASATPGPLGHGLTLGEPVTLSAAGSRVTFPVLVPTLAGFHAPDEIYVDSRPPGGRVTLLYRSRPGLPRTPETGAGLLLTEFRGLIDRPFIGKMVSEGNQIQSVNVGRDQGYWIRGKHFVILYLDGQSQVFVDPVRLAGSVLAWRHGEVTLRIESGLSKEAAVRIATSVRP